MVRKQQCTIVEIMVKLLGTSKENSDESRVDRSNKIT
jgi:hypothetical protein